MLLLFFNDSGPGVITGDLAATEAQDTAAFAGDVLVEGALAVTEATDVAALAGDVIVAGNLAATEAPDSAAVAGAVLVAGAMAATEAADTLAAGGVVQDALTVGDLAAVEAPDVLAAAGTILVAGALAGTEAADGLAGSGVVLVTGAVMAVEAQDAVALQGAVLVSGALAATEAPDTFAAGAMPPPEEESAAGGHYIVRPLPVTGSAFLVAPAAEFYGVGRVIPQVRGAGHLRGRPAIISGHGEQDFTALEDEELEWIERAGGLEDPPRERCHVCEATRLGKPGEGPGPSEPRAQGDREGRSGHSAGTEEHRGRAPGATGADRRREGGGVRGRAEAAPLQGLLGPRSGRGGGGLPGRVALTERQAELFRLIELVYEATGEPPSVLYLARRLHLHHSTVQAHLRVMCKRGWLRAPTPDGLPQAPPQ